MQIIAHLVINNNYLSSSEPANENYVRIFLKLLYITANIKQHFVLLLPEYI